MPKAALRQATRAQPDSQHAKRPRRLVFGFDDVLVHRLALNVGQMHYSSFVKGYEALPVRIVG
jgi:hypothetical protein